MCDDNNNKTAYAEQIFKLAEERKDELFYNSSSEHAIIVHQALAKNAQDYICIYSSSMCSEVSNNPLYCELIENFLKSGTNRKIQVVLTDYSDEFPQKPIAKVFVKFANQVEVKRFGGQVIYKEKPVHFTVSDDRAFRLETDINQKMAFGNFNSSLQAKDLKNVFDQVFSKSEAVHLR